MMDIQQLGLSSSSHTTCRLSFSTASRCLQFALSGPFFFFQYRQWLSLYIQIFFHFQQLGNKVYRNRGISEASYIAMPHCPSRSGGMSRNRTGPLYDTCICPRIEYPLLRSSGRACCGSHLFF